MFLFSCPHVIPTKPFMDFPIRLVLTKIDKFKMSLTSLVNIYPKTINLKSTIFLRGSFALQAFKGG